MDPTQVFYNGCWLSAKWPAKIEAAQSVTTYLIGEEPFSRIAYGKEDVEWPPGPCHDCGVLKGQYHVPLVCDVEQCPRCGYQVIGCACSYAGDEPDDDISDMTQVPLLERD